MTILFLYFNMLLIKWLFYSIYAKNKDIFDDYPISAQELLFLSVAISQS